MKFIKISFRIQCSRKIESFEKIIEFGLITKTDLSVTFVEQDAILKFIQHVCMCQSNSIS